MPLILGFGRQRQGLCVSGYHELHSKTPCQKTKGWQVSVGSSLAHGRHTKERLAYPPGLPMEKN